jgi:hypothetical protein
VAVGRVVLTLLESLLVVLVVEAQAVTEVLAINQVRQAQ